MSPKLLNILLVLTPLVLYYGYLDPMYTGAPGFIWTPESSIFALQSRNVQYANSLNQIDLIEQEVGKLYKDYQSIDVDAKTKVSTLLPDTLDPIKLRNEVVSIANRSGVAITGLQVTPDTKIQSKDTKGYLISFSFKSHYSVAKALMENYEKSMRLYLLDSVAIQRVDKKTTDNSPTQSGPIDDNETLTTAVIFRVYYLK